MSPAVHQFVPTLLPGDATGGHVLEVRRVLRDQLGCESDVYVETVQPGTEEEVLRFAEYTRRRRGDEILVYHLATASALADFLYALPEALVVDYHNVTPASYFERWDPRAAAAQAFGRFQLARLADRAALGLADSSYNEAELVEVGYGPTAVVPILVDVRRLSDTVDEATLGRLRAAKAREKGGSDWLFVGRIAPNKAQHRLVAALAAYRRLYDPKARLHLVGRASPERYLSAVLAYAAELGVGEAVHVVAGLSAPQLAAYYLGADVFVSASEHEGFCVPLLEAMAHDLPVVAFAAAAVPETVGEAGVLVGRNDPLQLAAAVARVLGDPGLVEVLRAAGRARLEAYDPARSRERLVSALRPLLRGSA